MPGVEGETKRVLVLWPLARLLEWTEFKRAAKSSRSEVERTPFAAAGTM